MTTAASVATPVALVSAKQHEATAVRYLEVIKGHTISSDEEYEDAGNVLKKIKTMMKEVDAERDTHVRPLNEVVRATNALFKPATDFLKQAESVLKAAIGKYSQEKQAEQRRLLVAASEAASHQRVVDLSPPQVAVTLLQAATAAAVPRVEGISTREVLVWDMVDPALVPMAYCSPDPAKITAAVAAGVRDIPGVVFRTEVRVTARTG